MKLDKSTKDKIITLKGYGVLRKMFYIDVENLSSNTPRRKHHRLKSFKEFQDFYDYLKGDIYDGVYFGYTFSPEEIERNKLELDKMNFVSFCSEDIYTYDYLEVREKVILKQSRELRLGPVYDKITCIGSNMPEDEYSLILFAFNEALFDQQYYETYKRGEFVLKRIWFDAYGMEITDTLTFFYFFDLVHFMEGNLSFFNSEDTQRLQCHLKNTGLHLQWPEQENRNQNEKARRIPSGLCLMMKFSFDVYLMVSK